MTGDVMPAEVTADGARVAELTASFVTLSGAGFAEPARHPFEVRCAAAAGAGFAGIGLHADDPGTDVEVLRAHGLKATELEFLSGWVTGPDGVVPESETERRLYALADGSGVAAGGHLSAGELAPYNREFDLAVGARRLAAVCRRAARHGLTVAVEAFPWSPISDIRTARALVEQSGADNAGLLIDVWHFYNCGATADDLDGISPHRIAAVQLNDGPRVTGGDLRHQARTTRFLPGEGDLDVAGLIRRIRATGYSGPYCVEVNHPAWRGLSADEAAHRAYTAARRLLDSV
ncbi:sugar phosphate isomerase/epimerase family protein [Streptomyces sp. NPDC058247]|uniref:sugar phosphate isomerase/epimerase family protein n=1 Tax=Streptomyces sp. NPDC058247 TaxID=3346401 RepID=UPI0036ED7BF6